MGLLTTEFPGLVTCERQVRNVMSKYQRGPTGSSCRELLQRLMLQQRADPDFFVDYKLNEDNELVGVLWITAEQRRAWLAAPDILIHDNTYNLDNMGFKLGNFNGIDELGRTIDLGTSLVLDETACTYEWQFSSWLHGMYDVPPTVVGTDADPAASIAVADVFPSSLYFWCLWHIMQNLNKNLKVWSFLLISFPIYMLHLLRYVAPPPPTPLLANDEGCSMTYVMYILALAQAKLRGLMPKFLTDFLVVSKTVGKVACVKRFDLLLDKYPDASSYLRNQLGGPTIERWGAAFLQTFTCNTRATSRSEGSNKDYKIGHKRNMNVLGVYENIVAVQEAKKKRRLLTNTVNKIDVVSSVIGAELWFKEAMRVIKTNCSPYAVELIVKQMTLSNNYVMRDMGLQGVVPDNTEVDPAIVTLTQGNNVMEVSDDIFDLSSFCTQFESRDDMDEFDPYRRGDIHDFISHHDLGGAYRILTLKHFKNEVLHYIVLYDKITLPHQSDAEIYTAFYCTCGDAITSGVPCRHFWAAHKAFSAAAFYLGAINKRWISSTTSGDYPVVTTEGVVGMTSPSRPLNVVSAQILNPLTMTHEDVPIEVFKHSRVCYGKLWGLVREVTCALTVKDNRVHQDKYNEFVVTCNKMLEELKDRAELQAASEQDRPVIRTLQAIDNVQDPKRKNNKSKENRVCSYCKQSSGHNRSTCPVRQADEIRLQAPTLDE